MALSKQSVISKIEVLEDGQIQIRRSRRVFDDGELVAEQYHREVLEPGQDVSGFGPRVQAIAGATWTPAVVSDYQAKKAAQA